ncbi:MAG TPA: tandem-95 repeat protein, partial [Nitrosopumilus sp.]|nr:tandem-95 repeat protein [Nitrosopumilus sp.]
TDAENDLATSAALSALTNVSITTAASCIAGVCTVGVTGTTDYNGPASFTYTVTAGGQVSNVATATLTINGVDDEPVALADSYMTDENTQLVVAAAGVLINDTDIDGDSLTAVLDVNVSGGTLTLNANGGFTYDPNTDFNGVDSFTYHANDGTADSNTVTVLITVNPVNEMHVQSIDMTAKVKGKSTKSQIFTSVTIVDANGPVAGAQVTIELTGFNAGVTDTVTTDSSGIAEFTFSSAKAGNTYTSSVTIVFKSGFTYDPPSIPSNSITI